MWDRVVGQERAVGLLQRAADGPIHAYLLAGPTGSGVAEAARCFSAALVCPDSGCGTCSACERALRGRHPDVIELEPAGTFIVVDQIEEVVREAFTSPFEAARKVIVIAEADRMNEAAANKLLKTLEEPSARTHFVLLTDAPEEMLPTVRSRCQRIDFSALSDGMLRSVLEAGGLEADVAARVARLASGRLDRARALAGPWEPLRRAAAEAAACAGTGSAARAVAGAEAIAAAVARVTEALEAAQKQEGKALERELAEAGYPDRLARRLRKDLEQRHTRASRRARTDALAEVLTALETYFRDVLVAPSPPDAGPVPPSLGVDDALAALDACASALSVILNRTVVNEALLLEHLLIELAQLAASGTAGASGTVGSPRRPSSSAGRAVLS